MSYPDFHIGRASDLEGSDRRLYRFFEILPGALAWLTIGLVVLFSWLKPHWIAFFIIAFDFYWIVKTAFLSAHLRVNWKKMKQNLKTDWEEKLNNLKWEHIWQMVVLPFYKEDYEVVKSTVEALASADYPKDKMIVVLAREERVIGSKEIAEEIEKEYGSRFYKFLITSHPDGQEGEIRGKGSNETWAGQRVKNYIIDPAGIPYEKIVVSVFDIDIYNLVHYYIITRN